MVAKCVGHLTQKPHTVAVLSRLLFYDVYVHVIFIYVSVYVYIYTYVCIICIIYIHILRHIQATAHSNTH